MRDDGSHGIAGESKEKEMMGVVGELGASRKRNTSSFIQAEDGIRGAQKSRRLGEVYKRQPEICSLQEKMPASASCWQRAFQMLYLVQIAGPFLIHI